MNLKIFFAAAVAFTLTAASCTKEKTTGAPAAEAVEADGALYAIDTMNSRVEWKGFKVVKTDNMSHFGTLKFESGDVTVKEGKLQSGTFVADMGSLQSVDLAQNLREKGELEAKLKSGDFFQTDKFPTASFVITKVSDARPASDYNTLLDGNFTLKGITRPMQFKANVALNDREITIATEPQDLNRQDFGVKFQLPVAEGVVRDEMNIQIFVKAMAH